MQYLRPRWAGNGNVNWHSFVHAIVHISLSPSPSSAWVVHLEAVASGWLPPWRTGPTILQLCQLCEWLEMAEESYLANTWRNPVPGLAFSLKTCCLPTVNPPAIWFMNHQTTAMHTAHLQYMSLSTLGHSLTVTECQDPRSGWRFQNPLWQIDREPLRRPY